MRLLIVTVLVLVWIPNGAVAAESLVFGGARGATRPTTPELLYVPGSTKKVCQLTGDFDRGLNRPTLSQTGKRYGVTG